MTISLSYRPCASVAKILYAPCTIRVPRADAGDVRRAYARSEQGRGVGSSLSVRALKGLSDPAR